MRGDVANLIRPRLGELIEDFYAEIERHPATRKVITGGSAQVERLKQSLRGWLEDLLEARCDREYVSRRSKAGWRHADIGLAQVYTNAAMSRLRRGLIRILSEPPLESSEHALATESLNKLLDLDMAIIEDAYQAEYLARQERIKRLATIGEFAGGVAHQLRNPLGIIHNSAYYLRESRHELSDDARDAFDEMERGLATCSRLVGDLLDYVREPKRLETTFHLITAIDEALAGMEIPAAVQLSRPSDRQHVVCQADKVQIVQIVTNLVRNAIEAMPQGGHLTLNVSAADNRGVVEVADDGDGIAPIDLGKIFEPLFSRKARGIGLGLAISRRFTELNHGTLEVESEQGRGTTFRLTLPCPKNDAIT